MIKTRLTVTEWNQEFSIPNKLSCEYGIYEANGELAGKIDFIYTMYYHHYDQNNQDTNDSIYKGYLVFDGQINDKKGSFAFVEEGTYGAKDTQAKLSIIPESATGDFEGITDSGTYVIQGEGMDLELDVEF